MMWDPVTHRAGGLSDVTPWGMMMPPLGAYQLFGGRGGKDSGWGTTFALAAIVGVGVFGYFIYRNLVVTKAGLRGAGRAFGMGD